MIEERRDRFLLEWTKGRLLKELLAIIFPSWKMLNPVTRFLQKEFLGWNLGGMVKSTEWASDITFSHLEGMSGVWMSLLLGIPDYDLTAAGGIGPAAG